MKLSEYHRQNSGPDITEFTAKLANIADRIENLLDGDIDKYELADVATFFFQLKTQYEELDRARKKFFHLVERLNKGIIPARMDLAGTDMLRVPEIARSFSKQEKMSASTVDKDALFEWLRDIGQEELIQETVNSGTLASFCRRMMLDEGIEPPEDAVKLTTYNVIGVTKYTPKVSVSK